MHENKHCACVHACAYEHTRTYDQCVRRACMNTLAHMTNVCGVRVCACVCPRAHIQCVCHACVCTHTYACVYGYIRARKQCVWRVCSSVTKIITEGGGLEIGKIVERYDCVTAEGVKKGRKRAKVSPRQFIAKNKCSEKYKIVYSLPQLSSEWWLRCSKWSSILRYLRVETPDFYNY